MLGVGWTEMLVIGVVALIVIGPRELPALMNRVGRVIGSIRRMGAEFQREINRTSGLDQLTDIRRSIAEPLRKTTADIRREFNAMGSDGTVKPTGVLKPADPKAESLVAEIKAQAGMVAPAAPDKIGAGAAMTGAPLRSGPTPAVTTPAEPSSAGPVKAPRKRSAKKPVESPAPAEAIAPAPAKKPRAKTAIAKKATAKKTAVNTPARKRAAPAGATPTETPLDPPGEGE